MGAGERILQQRFGTGDRAERFYSEQMLDHLNGRMREFIGRQEMMFVATADAGGNCDNTFRAGPPGFVYVVDERQLIWPEYRGNGVMASLGNIAENPHIGLIFVDFSDSIGLHVNGAASIVDDAEVRAALEGVPMDEAPGRRPERWVNVYVDEAYIHCAKHIPRMLKVPRQRSWGTDDSRRKGGDYFGARQERRDGAASGAPHG